MAEQTWTDDPVVADVTYIKAVHFDELMDAINAFETAYSITNSVWTQDEPDNTMDVEAVTMNEFKTALENLETLCGATLPVTNRQVVARLDDVLASDIEDVRTNMNYLQANECYLCHTCDNYTACSCNNTCHGYSSCSCNNSCHGYVSCTCNSTCNSDANCGKGDVACDQCDSSCYGYSGCSCNNKCHGYSACSCNSTCYGFVCVACDVANYEYPWS